MAVASALSHCLMLSTSSAIAVTAAGERRQLSASSSPCIVCGEQDGLSGMI
jgi:hypothetical protein